MKYILYILLILFLFTGSRPHTRFYMSGDYVIASPGEYVPLLLDSTTHTPYGINSSIPALISGAPAHTSQICGGAHHAFVIDNLGRAGGFDDNAAGELGDGTTTGRSNIVLISIDSAGNTLDPFSGIVCGGTAHGAFWATAGWTTSGKGYVWGNTQGGNLGNGTYGTLASTRPVQVSFSGGAFITKMLSGVDMVAQDSAGNIWTWGADGYDLFLGRGSSPAYMVPGKINIGGGRAIDIVGPGFFHLALLSNGHVWAWGDHHEYMGPTLTTDINTPRDITASLALPFPIAKIRSNSESTYFILTDGSLWAMGGTAVGTIGNGVELDFSRYGGYPLPYGTSNPFPYNWSQGQNELMQRAPVNIAPGKYDWVDVYAGCALNWAAYAIDAAAQLYSWGRNKSGPLGNGVADPLDGGNTYPNAMDVPWITAVTPLAVTSNIKVSCPICVTSPSTSPCNNYSIPVTAPPNANAGSTKNIFGTSTTMSATASGNGGAIITYTIWSQVSGPNTATFMFNSSLNSYVGGLIPGVYVFKMTVTDQNWRVTTSNVTVNVFPSSSIQISPGQRIIAH